jgi:hypothetical protein
MAKARGSSSTSVTNLSFNLIESAFLLLTQLSFPAYKHNINHRRPPVARQENVNAAVCISMLTSALDYHLCYLKYLRDVYVHKPPLPYTPYFNWVFDDTLSVKLPKLLKRPREKRLLAQLIEITCCRDWIVHPKFYAVTQSWGADFQDGRLRAMLLPGNKLRFKTIEHKMRRQYFTKILKLPLVPTWVSYVDAVVCILVFHRLLNLLEWRYENYARVGAITAYQRQTKELFAGWNWARSYPRELEDWAKGFFQSLSVTDQNKVKKRLGGRLGPYLKKKPPRPSLGGGGKYSLTKILQGRKSPPKPEFLYKPPPN